MSEVAIFTKKYGKRGSYTLWIVFRILMLTRKVHKNVAFYNCEMLNVTKD